MVDPFEQAILGFLSLWGRVPLRRKTPGVPEWGSVGPLVAQGIEEVGADGFCETIVPVG